MSRPDPDPKWQMIVGFIVDKIIELRMESSIDRAYLYIADQINSSAGREIVGLRAVQTWAWGQRTPSARTGAQDQLIKIYKSLGGRHYA